MGRTLLPFVFVVLILYEPAYAFRVLGIESVPGKSHWNFSRAVLRALTDSGHSVTVFTPFPDGTRANYTEVDLSDDLPIQVAVDAVTVLEAFGEPTKILPSITNMSRKFCNITYEKLEMKEILNSAKTNYDVVVAGMMISECASYVASKLNLPLVYVIPSPIITNLEYDLVGHVPNSMTVSHLMANHAIPRTLAQRFRNFVLFAFNLFIVRLKETSMETFDPQMYDLVQPTKPSLVFVNTHFITEAPRPMSPNVIQIGGIHLSTPKSIPHVSS